MLPTWANKLSVAVSVLSVFAGGGAWVFAQRLTAPSARVRLEEDQRRPVLFVRDFKAEERRISTRKYWETWKQIASILRPHTIEEVAAGVVQDLVPFVAIGKPGQRL